MSEAGRPERVQVMLTPMNEGADDWRFAIACQAARTIRELLRRALAVHGSK